MVGCLEWSGFSFLLLLLSSCFVSGSVCVCVCVCLVRGGGRGGRATAHIVMVLIVTVKNTEIKGRKLTVNREQTSLDAFSAFGCPTKVPGIWCLWRAISWRNARIRKGRQTVPRESADKEDDDIRSAHDFLTFGGWQMSRYR